MRRLAIMGVLALFATSGCVVSDKAFLANKAAERIYREDRYERECVQVVGPPTCAKRQAALNLLEHHENGKPVGLLPVANQVQQLGKLPKDEKAEISDALARSR